MPSKEYVNSAWQAAQADGVSADFDPAFRFELSSHYEQARLLAEHAHSYDVDLDAGVGQRLPFCIASNRAGRARTGGPAGCGYGRGIRPACPGAGDCGYGAAPG